MKKGRIIVLCLVAILSIGIFTACGNKKDTGSLNDGRESGASREESSRNAHEIMTDIGNDLSEAASGAGEGMSRAAETIGEGMSDAVSDLGEGMSRAAQRMEAR